ncbi:MAG: 5'-methylthioadenosine/adenosylhomocysteine nucleosidase [Clostridia bacterium]|nr:5'-methylthioadenosine/adenosylhomocysteine nucleosidase [Clostridia bacterium]
MIGIIGAMKIEIDGLKAVMTDKKSKTVSGVEFVSGKINGHDVVVAVCGIGKVFAAICAEAMILKYNVDLIINTGVGGSLNENLKIGDILVAEKVVQHDMDTSPLGDPRGLISGINVIYMPCDETAAAKLAAAAAEAGIACRRGTVATGDCFVNDSATKERIVSEFNADVCEMEGAAIGHVCYINKIPFVVVRAVSDDASGKSHMDYAEFASMAAANSIKVMEYFLA